jgi:fructose-1,6-bisphosphatase/inositol monophosphatase family enzyme
MNAGPWNAELLRRSAFAHRLADAAGAVIAPYFRRRIDVADKGPSGFYDPVTEADRRAEERVRAMIAAEFPEDSILGEEWGATTGSSPYRWVLDPIDGTRAFISGQPLWGTLIGLEQDGVPVLGVLDQVFLRERFVGNGKSAGPRGLARASPRPSSPPPIRCCISAPPSASAIGGSSAPAVCRAMAAIATPMGWWRWAWWIS